MSDEPGTGSLLPGFAIVDLPGYAKAPSPCNNKKLNGARGTGDRTKAMSQATALSPTPWALIIFLCQLGLGASVFGFALGLRTSATPSQAAVTGRVSLRSLASVFAKASVSGKPTPRQDDEIKRPHRSSADALLPRPTIFRPLCGLKIPLAFGSPNSDLASGSPYLFVNRLPRRSKHGIAVTRSRVNPKS